jgi:hypothetical protein
LDPGSAKEWVVTLATALGLALVQEWATELDPVSAKEWAVTLATALGLALVKEWAEMLEVE